MVVEAGGCTADLKAPSARQRDIVFVMCLAGGPSSPSTTANVYPALHSSNSDPSTCGERLDVMVQDGREKGADNVTER